MGGQSDIEKFKNAKMNLYFGVFLFGVLILDSFLKWVAFTFPRKNDFLDLFVSPFLNTGLPFGFPSIISPVILSVIVLVFLIIILIKKIEKFSKTFYLLISIIFFGLANLVERIYFGGVHDYIKIFQGYFNLADLVILFCLFYLLLGSKKKI